jgi:cytochrome b6-f complex subunit 8
MAALTQTCNIALPARAAARNTRRARSVVVAKAAAPVATVRVQQKVS